MSRGSPSTVDDRFAAFADRTRRTVLATLSEASAGDGRPSATVDELAAELADGLASDGGVEGPSIRRSSHSSARIELVHVHLPGLERAGFVTREEEGNVRLAVDSSLIEEGLELAARFERA
jgi:DNA-binding transcriptional ArsR family regulator